MILCPEVWGRCPTGEFPTFWADAPLLQSSRCSFLPCSREVIGLFSGWWLRTDGVSCLRHWAHKGIKVVWTAQTLRRSWPLWFSYLCISTVSLSPLWSFWWSGFSFQAVGSTRWNMWASKDCMCFYLFALCRFSTSVCFCVAGIQRADRPRKQWQHGPTTRRYMLLFNVLSGFLGGSLFERWSTTHTKWPRLQRLMWN